MNALTWRKRRPEPSLSDGMASALTLVLQAHRRAAREAQLEAAAEQIIDAVKESWPVIPDVVLDAMRREQHDPDGDPHTLDDLLDGIGQAAETLLMGNEDGRTEALAGVAALALLALGVDPSAVVFRG
jgi:hypothetical protein